MVMDLLGKMFTPCPIHWRRFYFKKLVEAKKKEKEEYDKASKKSGSRGPT